MGIARKAAEEVIAAFEAQDWVAVRSLAADGFTFSDPNSPNPPMDVDAWIAANQGVYAAFSDFSFNFEVIEEEDNRAWVRSHITGTHDGDWDLSILGIGVIPATGKYVSTSESITIGTVNADGLVEKIEVAEQDETGGFIGALRALGVNLG